MFVNFETTFAAAQAERHLANMRATKLGPLFVEVERQSAATTPTEAPTLSAVVQRLVDQLRSASHRWLRHAPEFGPSAGK